MTDRRTSVSPDGSLLDAEVVGRIIDEHYRARRDADPKGPPLHECGSYCGADIAARLVAIANPRAGMTPLISDQDHELAWIGGPDPGLDDQPFDPREGHGISGRPSMTIVTDAGDRQRAEAVARAPRLSDLRDTICFVERHEHLATTPYCNAGRAQAHRIREALIARYMYRLALLPTDTEAPK